MRSCARCFLSLAGAVAVALGASAGSASAQEERTLRFAGQHPPDHMGTQAIEAIAERIEGETDGRITFRLHPAGELGDYTLVYDEIMRGTVDMALISAPAQHEPRIEAQWLPYVAQDHDEVREVFGEGSFLYDQMHEYHGNVGIKFLGFFGEGFIGLGATEMPDNVAEPEESKGILVRVAPFRPAELVASDLGYRASTIDYADTYSALQTGVVEGWIGGTAELNYTGFRDVVEYFIPYNVFYEATSFFINAELWESLSAEDRELIQEAVREESMASFDISEEKDKEYLDRLREEGIEVVELSSEDLRTLAEFVRETTWPELEDRFGADLIESLRAEFLN